MEAGWLLEVAQPMVALSPPLDTPLPRYDPKTDAVLALHEATFGRHEWALPAARRPHPDPHTRARTFAAALLAGEVFPHFKGAEACRACRSGMLLTCMLQWLLWLCAGLRLVDAPGKAAAAHSQGERRVGDLVAALHQRSVASRAALAMAWRADPSYLRKELMAWMRKVRAAVA